MKKDQEALVHPKPSIKFCSLKFSTPVCEQMDHPIICYMQQLFYCCKKKFNDMAITYYS